MEKSSVDDRGRSQGQGTRRLETARAIAGRRLIESCVHDVCPTLQLPPRLRSRGLAGPLFQRRIARRVLYAWGMVYHAEKAVVESARLDLWAGLVVALHDDGGGGVAGLEARRFRRSTPSAAFVPRATRAQWGVVALVLRTALAGRGLC